MVPAPRLRGTGNGIVVVSAVVLGGALVAFAASTLRTPDSGDEAPYARWRNGVIVSVRNCDSPLREGARLRCAALYCAQRASVLLTNAQQARIQIVSVTRDTDSTAIRVDASLSQYLHSPRLPQGFYCEMTDFRVAEPQFVYARASATAAPGTGRRRAGPE